MGMRVKWVIKGQHDRCLWRECSVTATTSRFRCCTIIWEDVTIGGNWVKGIRDRSVSSHMCMWIYDDLKIKNWKNWYLLLIWLNSFTFLSWSELGRERAVRQGLKWENMETKPTINLTSHQAFRIQHRLRRQSKCFQLAILRFFGSQF